LVLQAAGAEYNRAVIVPVRPYHTAHGAPRRRIAAAVLFLGLACALPVAAAPPATAKSTAPGKPAAQTPATATPATPPASPASAPVSGGAADDACTTANLMSSALVTGSGSQGPLRTVQDNTLLMEGSAWDAPQSVRLLSAVSHLSIDLRAPHELRYLALQGDNNDSYAIEASLDGVTFHPLWTAPVYNEGIGLRTRSVVLPKAESVRYLRVRGVGGDSFYSVSELRAYCKVPKVWPPALIVPPEKHGWYALDNDNMVIVKGWVAAASVIVLLVHWLLRRRWKALDIGTDVSLAMLGLFSFFAWWNLGHFHFDHYEHIWEHYHYYIGAKYAPELRYSRLYECTAVADIEDGFRARVKKRHMRDLAVTNELGPSDAIIANPALCKDHFTPERWKAFREDIRFFRGRFSYDRWDESQTDHGYNGTPVWGILGRIVANTGQLDWNKIRIVAWIDSGLLVLMWVVTWWAFGWRSMCVALLWWGLDFPARFYWNGGSMLRYDWLFWLVVGICLLRKRYHFAAGMALTYTTLLRIFPGFVIAALMLKALARMVRLRRFVISRGHLRFAMGCILALAILIPASSWAGGGLDSWQQFAQNSRKHLHTALTNNMGLKTALGYDPRTSAKFLRDSNLADPFSTWKDARSYFYAKREPILLALLLLFCVMLARAGDREPDWSAACLGTGLIVMASELTCYYYGFLLAFGLMWERRKLPGVLITALAAVTCYFPNRLAWNDDHFTAMSLASAITVILTTAWIGFGPRPRLLQQPERAKTPERPAVPSADAPFTFGE
jgi:hypothetical protein